MVIKRLFFLNLVLLAPVLAVTGCGKHLHKLTCIIISYVNLDLPVIWDYLVIMSTTILRPRQFTFQTVIWLKWWININYSMVKGMLLFCFFYTVVKLAIWEDVLDEYIQSIRWVPEVNETSFWSHRWYSQDVQIQSSTFVLRRNLGNNWIWSSTPLNKWIFSQWMPFVCHTTMKQKFIGISIYTWHEIG